ncbi:hypothetical protein LTS16_016212 [Friedmanniomyces endolithicus]|nr:hypothetical protein LTS09_001532 [Friedmanniomyces endolithicus]KAK0304526.1 hypothetical protein LTR01_007319 [Friedmanniomyces endolithicus]KAK0826670.1 hypothetical protein LTR73_006004 [Friedmanniomyces endolithicus]KAK0932132.1 hypothetical protein LTR57_000352 [Friedmanniomyces endolithicus]KAK1033543.1 hypothetical protein LTS16_016212 [Friedmanniomyces endolithicus]
MPDSLDPGQVMMHDEMDHYDVDSNATANGDVGTTFFASSSSSRPGQAIEHTTCRSRGAPRTSLQSDSLVMQTADVRHVKVEDDAPVSELPRMQTFWMHESTKVEACMVSRIEALQQLSGKKVSKDWIKAICPRKQARFPYSRGPKKKPAVKDTMENKFEEHLNSDTDAEEDDRAGVPQWWPDTKVCPWKEPDHVRKHERNGLMLHLLRLRPTPDDLKRMNGDGFEPHSTHVLRSWTAFLRESAPPESLDELNPKDATRVEKRRRLLMEIYEIAEMEEEYMTPGPDWRCSYEEINGPVPVVIKRRRRSPSVSSTQDADGEDVKPPRASACREKKPAKRSRGNREVTTDASRNLARQMSTFGIGTGPQLEEAPVPAAINKKMHHGPARSHRAPPSDNKLALSVPAAFVPTPRAAVAHHHGLPLRCDHGTADPRQDSIAHLPSQMHHHHWLPANTSPTTSFSSSSTTQGSTSDVYQLDPSTQSCYPYQHEHTFSGYQPAQQQHYVQAHLLYDLPEPQYHPTPSTPMFPDLELGQQLYPAPQQEQQQVFTQASEPVMHGMPLATHDPAVQAFHGQATNQQVPHGGLPVFPLSAISQASAYAAYMNQPAIRGGMAIQQFPHDMAIDPQQGMCSGPSMQRYPHESAALRPQHHRADIHGLPMAYNQTGTAMQLTGSTYPSQA